MNINIITICTGKYINFFDRLYESCEKYFLCGYKKTYYVFTDGELLNNKNVIKINQNKLGWPYDTMMRFHMFKRLLLDPNDYMFFLNANMLFVNFVDEEVLPKQDNDYLMGVKHPGFYDKTPGFFPYERRRDSHLNIQHGGKYYYQGCFNGGRVKEFMEMSNSLAFLIDEDLKKSIIPVWHDESALNWYYSFKSPLTLDSGYAYPESWSIPFDKKILQLDKSKYGGHDYLRNDQ